MKKPLLLLLSLLLFLYVYSGDTNQENTQENPTSANKLVDDYSLYSKEELHNELIALNKQIKDGEALLNYFKSFSQKLTDKVLEQDIDRILEQNKIKKNPNLLIDIDAAISNDIYPSIYLAQSPKADMFFSAEGNSISKFRRKFSLDNIYGNMESQSSNSSKILSPGFKTALGELVSELKKQAEDATTDVQADISSCQEKLKTLRKSMENQDQTIQMIAVKWGLPFFCGTIIFLFLGSQLIRAFSTPSIRTFNTTVLLEVSTVLLVTLSILILGLAKLITSEVLGTLLGSISAYVLNKTGKSLRDATPPLMPPGLPFPPPAPPAK